MDNLMTFEGFFNIFKRKTDEERLEELKDMEHRLEFPKRFDPYLWHSYVNKLEKYFKNPDNISTFDIGNSLRIFRLVSKRQKMLPSSFDKYHKLIARNYNRW